MLALRFQTADGSMEVYLLVGESDGFYGLRQRAVDVTVDQRTFLVASINDLISMSGVPADHKTGWISPNCATSRNGWTDPGAGSSFRKRASQARGASDLPSRLPYG